MPPVTPLEFDTPVIPEVIDPQGTRDYFAVMTRAVFQAGVSWAQIARHWNAYGRAFKGFDVPAVATYDEIGVERVLAEPGILKMPRKIRATIANAQALLAIEQEFGGMPAYIASFNDYASLVKAFKKRFSFMGDMNVWYVLFRTHHTVPSFEAWVTTIPGDHPRMHEMVELARATGRSPELR
jgi:3-methyladenine DNA glycosylase Tag